MQCVNFANCENKAPVLQLPLSQYRRLSLARLHLLIALGRRSVGDEVFRMRIVGL